VDDEPWPLPNPLGVVPLVPLVNRPRLLPRRYISVEGTSELKQVIPVQDAVNKLLLDMLVASEFGAFRQRWVTGMDIPRDPDTDAPVEPFKAAVDRLWMAEDPAVKFGEFAATDLTAYVKSTEMLVQHIASQTRTPPHYFYLSGQFPSGESIKSAETGLVAKARRKMRHFEEGWEEMIRLSFRVLGDPRADFVGAETIWADPESRTEGEHVDATLKKKALDVPIQQLWEDLGYSPQQIGRFREMLAEQAFLAALAAPPAPEPGPPPPEVP
jgi:Phage portal protein, SPP1 Gp6-like